MSTEKIKELQDLKQKVSQGGGEKRIKKQHELAK